IIGAGQRDAYALARIAMPVDDDRGSRILLEPERDVIEASLVLVVDAGRVEWEEDRAARHHRINGWRLSHANRHRGSATAARASLSAVSLIRRHIYGHSNAGAG